MRSPSVFKGQGSDTVTDWCGSSVGRGSSPWRTVSPLRRTSYRTVRYEDSSVKSRWFVSTISPPGAAFQAARSGRRAFLYSSRPVCGVRSG